ncbi:MAG: DUF1667 domain-containing protein [Coriobacteriia bacterium]
MAEATERELVCIVCPTGCRLRVRVDGDAIEVRGAACERGRDYARCECSTPVRSFTGTVRVRGGSLPLVAVRSDGMVHRDALLEVARAAGRVVAEAPVGAGDVVAEGLPGGARLVATASVGRRV